MIYLNTNSSSPSESGENCHRVKFVFDGNGTNFAKAAVRNAIDSFGPEWMLVTNDYVWGHDTSALFAGLAGGLFAMAQQSAYPDVMSVHQSGLIVMMVLVGGGLVSFWGPVLGVALYFIARDVLGTFTEAWLLWFGLMFMGLVMFKPEGLAGILHSARRLFARAPIRRQAPAE